MEARIVNIETLFKMPISYRIPQFQRPYTWRLDSQWKPLWDDIASRANQSLSGNGVRAHFMGAIVLQRITNSTGEVEKRLVVDGQQRLTTLQLLIKAIEDAFISENDNVRADRFSKLSINDDSQLANDNDNDTKIRQSNRNDQTAFQEVIRNSNSSRISPICDAFDFFKDQVTLWLSQNVTNWNDRANALERAITRQVQVAAIDLDEDEEPHVIFETLNERGEPLTQSDRIKNTVMYKADVVDDANAARNLWGMFEEEWWRRNTNEGRLTRTENDRFLHYWVVMKNPSQINSEEVAAKFRSLLNGIDAKYANIDIEDVAAEIRYSGRFYRNIEEGKIPEMDSFLRKIKALEIGAVYPVLMWLDASNVPQQIRAKCHFSLESYLVRRYLCGLGSQGINRFFEELIKALDREDPGNAGIILIDHLKKQTIDNRLWPSDLIVKNQLLSGPLKGTVARQKMIMEAIEMSLRGDKSESIIDTKNLTLEHIMPVKWENNWPLPKPTEDNPEPQESRKNSIKEIGNLTLVTQKLNSSTSNGSWVVKREALDNHSSLFLNKNLLNSVPDGEEWNEITIRQRSIALAEQVIQIWPHADGIS